MTETFLTKSFMQQFCSTDSLRPIQTVIFPAEGYYVATDSRHMLLVPETDCHFTLDYVPARHGKPMNVGAVIDPKKLTATHSISLSDLRDWISRNATDDETEDVAVPTEFKECDCDECDNGRITLTTNARWRGKWLDIEEEVDCPVCHGFGKIPVDPDYDPDECDDEDDVAQWVTYEHRPTGRKIFSSETAAYISTFCTRPSYLFYLVKLMEQLQVDTASFCIHDHLIAFLFGSVTYVIAGVYEAGCRNDHWRFIDEIVPSVEL